MSKINILWTDDEIDLLKAHIIFLEQKGYNVITANNGDKALELVKQYNFDIILLDENMPGVSGLTVLEEIKKIFPAIPIIMITKSEEEDIMDQAIGSKITDYLIKPVNPKQILLTIKKNTEHRKLVTEKTTSAYQSTFSKLGVQINMANNFNDWVEIYRQLVYWEIELERLNDNTMDEVLKMQKSEANINFSKYIKNNYFSFFEKNNNDKPLISPNIFKETVFPLLKNKGKVFVMLIDNLRFDQWKIMQPIIREYFHLADEKIACSILPTATQYARNAMFSGLMPSEIAKIYPDLWLNDEEDGGKNLYEEDMLKNQISRTGQTISYYYDKIGNHSSGQKLIDRFKDIISNDLMVVVYNFVDILSHARTEMKMIRELANDEAAYRSLTLSWFRHSSMLEMLKLLAENKIKVVITTDHGATRVKNPIKVIGDKNTTTNLRYKQGKNLNYNPKQVFEINDPAKAFLPSTNVSSKYIFAMGEDFFAYPNNYNHYVKYYKDTFQHGGISMEEMLLPLITLSPK